MFNFVNSRRTKFLSYYKPYLGLLTTDLVCACVVSAIVLILPLGARYITKDALEGGLPNALNRIYVVGAACSPSSSCIRCATRSSTIRGT